jgi:radical SAM superfamily enzyme YgiQ (UPF0313 family)
MYKKTHFRIRPVQDIKEDLLAARDYYGKYVASIFFPDGNTIIMKTEQLVEIFNYANELFPELERITVYGSARFVNKKSVEDLKRLKAAGLKRIHMGMESGDDVVLQKINKGTNSAEIIEAGLKLKNAGIQTSEYYLVGIGGKARWQQHAENSARVLNAFSPDFIRLRTFAPERNTPILEEIRSGQFEYLSPHEALQEIRVLIENLNCNNSKVLSDHITNYWNINGIIPEDKDKMLAEIDKALEIDESLFMTPNLGHP